MNIGLSKNYVLIELKTQKTTDSGLVIAGQKVDTGIVIESSKNLVYLKDKEVYFGLVTKEITLEDKRYLIVHKKEIFAWLK